MESVRWHDSKFQGGFLPNVLSVCVQFFDAAFSKQHPHAARYLATMYAQPAWLRAATAPLVPPSKAFTFADAVNGKTFAKVGGQHAAALVERYKPLHWSGMNLTT